MASTSRPVGNSRRLRSEGRRSNNNLGSSEHSSLRRGRGEKPARASSKKGLPARRRSECSLCWNDDHCHGSSSLSSKSRLSEWGSAYIPQVYMQGQYNTSKPWSPFSAPSQCPTVSWYLPPSLPLSRALRQAAARRLRPPDSWEGALPLPLPLLLGL